MATRWFLIDTFGDVVAEAELKGILMYRWNLITVKKRGNIYLVYKDVTETLKLNYYIIKDVDMKKEGFGQALKNWDNRKSEDD